MKTLSLLTQTVGQSGIRKMFNRTYGMEGIVSFALGEPDFSAPERVVKAANSCNESGFTKYTPNVGLMQLREKIAEAAAAYGIAADPETDIIITNGGMEALFMLMQVLLDPGDEVLVSDPYWCNHVQQIQMAGARPVPVPVREVDGFIFTIDALERSVTPRTKAIILNSPANPTGGVAESAQLAAIRAFAIKHDLYVISDEVYKRFLYDGKAHVSIASLPDMRERTIVIDSFSKTYAMTGWRVGCAIGNREIITQMTKLHEGISSCVNSSAQLGAIAALDEPADEMERVLHSFDQRRRLIVARLNAIEGISCIMPKGAFYAFPNISALGMTAEAFTVKLLDDQKVIMIPGTAFGEAGEGFARISYATDEDTIQRGMDRLERFVRICRGA